MDYRQRAAEIARAYGLDPDIFVRQIETESGFNPRAVSSAGAGGLAQIMPATARQPGFGIDPISDEARFDPEASLNFGAQYMRAMLDRYDGDYRRALAAYNAGPRAVDRANGLPNIAETQNYVNRILGGQGDGTVVASSRGMGEDNPMGLLGALGIQRRDPSAEGETALPFYQRPTFQNTMGRLALAFNELRDEPSRTLPAIINARQEGRRESAQANRTIDWLSSQPNGAPYAQMIEAGASPAAAIQAYLEAQRAAASGADTPAGFRLLQMQAEAAGLEPGTPEYQEFMLYGGAQRDNRPTAFMALHEQALAAGYEEGSPEYQEFMRTRGAGEVAAARAQGAAAGAAGVDLAGARVSADRTLNLIDLVRNDPALPDMIGPVEGILPNISADARRFQSRLDQLQGVAFLEAYNMLRGGGQITENEGNKAQDAIARLQTAQSEEDFLQALTEFEDAVRVGIQKLEAQAGVGVGGGAAPAATGTGGATPAENDPLGIR